jgi:hypothetical protein
VRDLRDVSTSLRAVSRLRGLCLRLPHIATPAEERLLARFEQIVAAPTSATAADVDAITTGWRTWWRAGRPNEIATMARELPSDLVDGDRWLATFAVAAGARR